MCFVIFVEEVVKYETCATSLGLYSCLTQKAVDYYSATCNSLAQEADLSLPSPLRPRL